MAGFRAAFMNEIVKLSKRKKLITAAVLSILAVLIGQAAVTAVQSGFGLRVAGSAEFPLVVLPVFAYTILPLFATFVAIDLFSGEFASGTMKLTLTRPVSRFGVFSSKVAAVATFIFSNLVFVMVLAMAAGILFNPASLGIGGIIKIVVAYVVTFVPIFVFSLLVVVFSTLLRSGVAVFFLTILVYIASLALSFIYSGYSSFFITSQFSWYMSWISESMNGIKLLRQTLLMAGCGIMLYTAGFYLFDRKDL